MSFEQNLVVYNANHTSLDSWSTQQLVSVTNSEDRIKTRNLSLRGMYWIDQTTEVNTQYGAVAVALLRVPDSLTSPSPDVATVGIDRMIKKLIIVLAAGQNNPVLFSFNYRAINVGPGETLLIASSAKQESTTGVNHRVNLAGTIWQSDD